MKLLFTMLLFSFFGRSYSQANLIGIWSLVSPHSKSEYVISKQNRPGDFEVRNDHTFHIEGDTGTQDSTLSGWHVGEEHKGTWELDDKNRLTLWLEPKEAGLFLNYKVVKLGKKKLVLRSSLNLMDKRNDIVYVRL